GVAFAQDTVIWQDNVEGWSVAVDRTIENSCFILAGFDNDVFLRFQFNATKESVQFIVANIHWNTLQSGGDYDMEVIFDDGEAWAGMAKAHTWNDVLPSLVLSVPVKDQQASNFMKSFTDMDSVSISHAGAEIAELSVSGTEAAVASMLNCQASMSSLSKSGEDKTGDFEPASDPV
ncbi:MAG: hypothetical protein AAF665_19910, partial [Pseudomonadota bacterium]